MEEDNKLEQEMQVNNPEHDAFATEMAEMRLQIGLLKNKLADEVIVNERLIRQVTQSRMSVIKHQAVIEYVSVIFCCIIFPLVFPPLGFSWWLVGITIAMVLFSGIMTVVQHRHMNSSDAMNGNLLTVARNARKLKQDYLDWIKWAILMVIFWFSWVVTECLVRVDDRMLGIAMAIGGSIGLVIGGSIGLSMHRKVVRACDDIINQIDEQ